MRMTLPAAILGLWAVIAPPFLRAVQAQSPKQVTVEITSPQNGDTVSGPVVIKLRATGVRIVPASVERPGTGHHHLFVDKDMNWIGDTIPMGSSGILHLSRGQTEFVLDSLAPGTHRVIALLADSRHIPLNPIASDTVTFVVK